MAATRLEEAAAHRTLEDLVRERRRSEFEKAMAEVAQDPSIILECAAIQREFAQAEADGLNLH